MFKNKKILLLTVLIIVAIASISVFFLNNKINNKITHNQKVTIGLVPWPGYMALYVADKKGFFKQVGLDLEIKSYDSLSELSKDYVAGKMWGRTNIGLDAVRESLSGFDQKIILAIDYSNGSDAILAKKEIKTIRDLKDKQVAYDPKTLEEFFLVWALRESNLTLEDIKPVFANPEDSAQKLAMSEVDAAVTYEPFVSKNLPSPDFHIVYSSANAPGLITDVMTFRSDLLKIHPDEISLFVKAYFMAIDFWKQNPIEAEEILAESLGTDRLDIEKQLKGVSILDERDNLTSFTFASGLDSLYGNLRKIGEFVLSHNQDQPIKTLDTDALIEPVFVRNLLR